MKLGHHFKAESFVVGTGFRANIWREKDFIPNLSCVGWGSVHWPFNLDILSFDQIGWYIDRKDLLIPAQVCKLVLLSVHHFLVNLFLKKFMPVRIG